MKLVSSTTGWLLLKFKKIISSVSFDEEKIFYFCKWGNLVYDGWEQFPPAFSFGVSAMGLGNIVP